MLLKVPDFGRLSWPVLAPLQCSRHLKEKILWHSVACGVAVRSLAVVQCTSMVALAPNSSETSPWDILDGFPKLHSRAREAKPRSCTEAPHSKSFGRVEIWLVIYESCVGLESFTRDPIGFLGGINLYDYVAGQSLGSLDPSGNIPITCGCLKYGRQYGGPTSSPAIEQFNVSVNCGGLASSCCSNACGPGWWGGHWWIVPQPPQPEIDSCPGDWTQGTDYLTCVACCVKNYEFWNSAVAVCGVGGIRVPKPHIQPGQYPGQTWLYGPRRCLPRWCRPTLWQVRLVGRCSGILFIVEGCYDVGVEGTCAAYCAAR